MAGLGRVQQRFNAAIVTLLTLAGLKHMAGKDAKEDAGRGFGHPVHRTVLKGKLDGCPAGFHLRHQKHCVHYGDYGR